MFVNLGEQLTEAILPYVLRLVWGVTAQERVDRVSTMTNGQRMLEVNNKSFFFKPFILSIYIYI